MALSSVAYTGNGSLKLYTVPFLYLDKTHVKVYLNGVLTTAYTWSSASIINFNTAPGSGVAISIERDTPSDGRLVSYSDVSTLTAANLDKSDQQNFYLIQEIKDAIAGDSSPAALVSRVAEAESDIVALEGRMTTAEGNITTLQGNVTSLSSGKSDVGHPHIIANITGLQTALDGKAALSHTHTSSQITDFNTAVDARIGALSSGVTSFNGRTGIVTAQATDYSSFYANVTHTHSISDITGLQTALDGKAATSHTHTASQISDSTTAGRALLTGADAAAQRTSLGLGTAATQASTAFAEASHSHAIADLPEATTAQFLNNTADKVLSTDQVWAAGGLVSLTDAATVAVDMSAGINFTVTLAGNRTLGAPSNTKVGQSGVIYVVQGSPGSRTLAYDSNWKFAGGTAPTLSTASDAVDRLTYFVRSSTHIDVDISKDRK